MDSITSIISHGVFLLLGAGIAAFFAWVFRRDSARSGAAREQTARRMALVEDVALQTGAAQQLFLKYFALVAESVRFKEEWPRQRREELASLSLQLVETVNDLALAESRLLLLDERNLCKILRAYSARIASFKKAQYARAGASDEELAEARKQISSLYDKFFELLSARYGRH